MSTRTEYQRPPGFGATRASTKAGLKYEEKAAAAILALLRDERSEPKVRELANTFFRDERSEPQVRAQGFPPEPQVRGSGFAPSPAPRSGFPVRLEAQFPRNGGRVDLALTFAGLPRFLIEVKSQWSGAAYKQLLRYAGSELSAVSRVCICRTYHPHVPVPESVTCLTLARLLEAPRGSLTVIPWSGRP